MYVIGQYALESHTVLLPILCTVYCVHTNLRCLCHTPLVLHLRKVTVSWVCAQLLAEVTHTWIWCTGIEIPVYNMWFVDNLVEFGNGAVGVEKTKHYVNYTWQTCQL